MEFLRYVRVLAWKDVQIEFRSREIVYTMTFFAGMVVLLFSIAFLRESSGPDKEMITDASLSPGFIWTAVLFAGSLGLSRSFSRERESESMRGLLLSPMPRSAIFLGKAVGIFVMVLVVQMSVVPMVALFFNVALFEQIPALVSITLLGTFGFAVVGAVFSAMLLKTGSREVLLPVVLYPILIPMFIAVIKGTTSMMSGTMGDCWFWVRFLVAYDMIFMVAALWTFESLVIE